MFAPATTPPRLVTLVILTSVSVLSLNMFLPSLPGMARDLQADYATVSLSVSGYLAVTALLQIVMGPLSDRYGRRPLLLAGAALFAVASVICATAQSIELFLAGRVLQGAIISGAALSSAVIRDMTDERGAASLMGYVSMAMAVAPMTAPMIGGVLEQMFGWRANFWLFSGLGALVLWLVWADLGETNASGAPSLGQQMRSYPELLGSRRFWGYAICAMFSVGGFYAFIAGAPLVATAVFQISPAWLGAGIGSITAGFFCGSYLSGRLGARVPVIRLVLAGRLVALTAMSLALTVLLAGQFSVWSFFGAAVSFGFGNGLTVPGARVGAMSVRPRLAGSASGLSGAMVVAGGAVLTQLSAMVATPETAALTVTLLMLVCALGGLLAALYVLWVDRQEGVLPG